MNKYIAKNVAAMQAYTPGEQPQDRDIIKLNTNENPYPPSPQVIAAVAAFRPERLRLYPDPEAARLKNAIARYSRVLPGQVFVGNGSDEVLGHAFQGLLKHDRPLLFPDISYSFYPVYCGLYGITQRTLALNDRFEIDVDDYLNAPDCGAVIFPNPNAPTGCLLPLAEIERLLAGKPDVAVVVDEAYIDFAGQESMSAIALVDRHPNLLVVQTLSKSRSLAGLRVGFAVGHASLIEALERIKNSFNSYPLDRLAIAGAVAAMEDHAYFESTRAAVIHSRERLVRDLSDLGFAVLPSAANFIFARHPDHDAGELASALRARSIIVRHFRQARIAQFLRISIGNDAQCAALTTALREIVGDPRNESP